MSCRIKSYKDFVKYRIYDKNVATGNRELEQIEKRLIMTSSTVLSQARSLLTLEKYKLLVSSKSI